MKLAYFLPVAIGISLVYCGTRYEDRGVILRRSATFLLRTLLFMTLLYAALYVIARLV